MVFSEQILQILVDVIFDFSDDLLELYQLENGRYGLKQPDENGRDWIDSINLFLGT
ncbi:hypothetical protein [Gloeocapsopsis sp. IPPAS B-1203]|uniref:hypothetical protein n=1 Tax=Gloeocapsopsis sp. IPPAS B-1203 TaxID=2049454 RepID=UPI0025A281DE|nr:hypothetical protein [Gloeocapsopsis sp. IPPAS B-1203]